MKRTEITYRKLKGKGLKGLIWVSDIKNAVAKDGLPYEYLSKKPYYYLKDHCFEGLVLHIAGQERETELEEGMRYSSLDFGYIINVMQQAGERLSDILHHKNLWGIGLIPPIDIRKCEYLGKGIYRLYLSVEYTRYSSKIIRRKNKDGSITLII